MLLACGASCCLSLIHSYRGPHFIHSITNVLFNTVYVYHVWVTTQSTHYYVQLSGMDESHAERDTDAARYNSLTEENVQLLEHGPVVVSSLRERLAPDQ
jgi:hypothetical protein